jgi:hypothetical protein
VLEKISTHTNRWAKFTGTGEAQEPPGGGNWGRSTNRSRSVGLGSGNDDGVGRVQTEGVESAVRGVFAAMPVMAQTINQFADAAAAGATGGEWRLSMLFMCRLKFRRRPTLVLPGCQGHNSRLLSSNLIY